MYRALLYITALTLTILLAACSSCSSNSKKNVQGGMKDINPMVSELDNTPDEAIAGVLKNVTSDSIYVLTAGKTLSYDFTHAKAEGTLHGTLKKGDKVSVFPDNKQKVALIIINTTELSGRWFYDQKQHRGIDFNEHGGMSSINSENNCFREWKLLNGKLYIYYVMMQDIADDRHRYSVEEAQITELSKNRLTLVLNGETYYCLRPSNKPIMFN